MLGAKAEDLVFRKRRSSVIQESSISANSLKRTFFCSFPEELAITTEAPSPTATAYAMFSPFGDSVAAYVSLGRTTPSVVVPT